MREQIHTLFFVVFVRLKPHLVVYRCIGAGADSRVFREERNCCSNDAERSENIGFSRFKAMAQTRNLPPASGEKVKYTVITYKKATN